MKGIAAFFTSLLFVVASTSLWETHSVTMFAVGYVLMVYVLVQRPKASWGTYGLCGYALSLELLGRQPFGLHLIMACAVYGLCKLSENFAYNTSKSVRFSLISLGAVFALPLVVTGDPKAFAPLFPSLLLVWLSAIVARQYFVSRSHLHTYDLI